METPRMLAVCALLMTHCFVMGMQQSGDLQEHRFTLALAIENNNSQGVDEWFFRNNLDSEIIPDIVADVCGERTMFSLTKRAEDIACIFDLFENNGKKLGAMIKYPLEEDRYKEHFASVSRIFTEREKVFVDRIAGRFGENIVQKAQNAIDTIYNQTEDLLCNGDSENFKDQINYYEFCLENKERVDKWIRQCIGLAADHKEKKAKAIEVFEYILSKIILSDQEKHMYARVAIDSTSFAVLPHLIKNQYDCERKGLDSKTIFEYFTEKFQSSGHDRKYTEYIKFLIEKRSTV